MTAPYPLWADATEIELRFWEPDAERHDVDDDAIWPEIVDDRCRICGQVVHDGLIECQECFIAEDTRARRREDW